MAGRVAKHFNGTAVATIAQVSFGKQCQHLIIRNLDAAGGDDLRVSFDKGSTYFSIPPAEQLNAPVLAHEMWISSNGTTTYCALVFG